MVVLADFPKDSKQRGTLTAAFQAPEYNKSDRLELQWLARLDEFRAHHTNFLHRPRACRARRPLLVYQAEKLDWRLLRSLRTFLL